MTEQPRLDDRTAVIPVDIPAEPIRTVPVRVDLELRYEVTCGRVRVTIDGVSRTYRAGEILIVPAGATHTFEALGPDGLRVLRHLPGADDGPGADRRSGDRAGGWETPWQA